MVGKKQFQDSELGINFFDIQPSKLKSLQFLPSTLMMVTDQWQKEDVSSVRGFLLAIDDSFETGSLLGEQQYSSQCQNTCWPVPRGK